MSTTYRAVEVARPGLLQVTQRPLKEPTAGQVRIRVEACGVCHSDSATVDGLLPGITFPRVPGHEVVGRIDAVGQGVSGWKIGQRVGVGFLGGHCGQCQSCRRGDFVNCTNQPISGAHFDGGYAEVMMAFPNGLVTIPDGLSSVGGLIERFSPAPLGTAVAPDSAGFLFIDRKKFHSVFASDLPEQEASVLAAAQKPLAASIFGEPIKAAAWKSTPSWYVVSTQDSAINPDLERFMAKRMNAKATEIKSSHVSYISNPSQIAKVIESAAASVG